jgi:hypothetical protein
MRTRILDQVALGWAIGGALALDDGGGELDGVVAAQPVLEAWPAPREYG